LNISPRSLRNYRSDFLHFFAWSILRLKNFGSYIEDLSELVPFLSHQFASEYKAYMTENSMPVKSVNRRLSTLRHLSKFLLAEGLTEYDFTATVENIGSVQKNQPLLASLVDDFSSHLESENVSKNTIKNYQSDIRQFLSWLEKNHARFT